MIIPTIEVIYWACVLDEQLELNDAPYGDSPDFGREVLLGTRFARNRAPHQLPTLIKKRFELSVPLTVPVRLEGWRFRTRGCRASRRSGSRSKVACPGQSAAVRARWGEVAVLAYGPDTDALNRVMEPGLRALPFRSTHVVLRYGESGEGVLRERVISEPPPPFHVGPLKWWWGRPQVGGFWRGASLPAQM